MLFPSLVRLLVSKGDQVSPEAAAKSGRYSKLDIRDLSGAGLTLDLKDHLGATASTPIAAALILKSVSPGAALVFLLAGPAINITSLTVLLRILGKRATVIYLAAIAILAVVFGLALDQVYASLGLSAQAMEPTLNSLLTCPKK